MSRPSGFALVVAVLVAAAACVDRPALFEPEKPGGGVRLTLPPGSLAVYERDTVVLQIDAGEAGGARVQMLLLDSTRTVRWRSAEVPVRGFHVAVPVEDVPPTVERGAELLVTAVLSDDSGSRFYASDDSASVSALARAAVRPVRIYAGRRIRGGAGSYPADLALAPELGWAFFPVPEDGRVGVLELAGEGRVAGYFDVGPRPERVAYRAGVLAVLGAGGGEVSWVRAAAGEAPAVVGRMLLPPLELELDTLTTVAVRPVGQAIRLACGDPVCASPHALLPSGVQVIDGTVPHPAGAGVLRVLRMADPGDGLTGPIVLPGHNAAVRGDTMLTAAVFAPTADGRTRVQARTDASGCLATALGGVHVAASADGVVYAAGAGTQPACGAGTGLVRIEDAATPAARLSTVAVHNSLADDRIGRVLDLQLSDDGTALLVLGDESIAVLDPLLRVQAILPAPGARAIAWRRGGGAGRFAIADGNGVSVYDAGRLTRIARIPLGPTSGPIVYLSRGAGPGVIAAAIPGGFAVATASDP